jgi:hypothetical protein
LATRAGDHVTGTIVRNAGRTRMNQISYFTKLDTETEHRNVMYISDEALRAGQRIDGIVVVCSPSKLIVKPENSLFDFDLEMIANQHNRELNLPPSASIRKGTALELHPVRYNETFHMGEYNFHIDAEPVYSPLERAEFIVNRVDGAKDSKVYYLHFSPGAIARKRHENLKHSIDNNAEKLEQFLQDAHSAFNNFELSLARELTSAGLALINDVESLPDHKRPVSYELTVSGFIRSAKEELYLLGLEVEVLSRLSRAEPAWIHQFMRTKGSLAPESIRNYSYTPDANNEQPILGLFDQEMLWEMAALPVCGEFECFMDAVRDIVGSISSALLQGKLPGSRPDYSSRFPELHHIFTDTFLVLGIKGKQLGGYELIDKRDRALLKLEQYDPRWKQVRELGDIILIEELDRILELKRPNSDQLQPITLEDKLAQKQYRYRRGPEVPQNCPSKPIGTFYLALNDTGQEVEVRLPMVEAEKGKHAETDNLKLFVFNQVLADTGLAEVIDTSRQIRGKHLIIQKAHLLGILPNLEEAARYLLWYSKVIEFSESNPQLVFGNDLSHRLGIMEDIYRNHRHQLNYHPSKFELLVALGRLKEMTSSVLPRSPSPFLTSSQLESLERIQDNFEELYRFTHLAIRKHIKPEKKHLLREMLKTPLQIEFDEFKAIRKNLKPIYNFLERIGYLQGTNPQAARAIVNDLITSPEELTAYLERRIMEWAPETLAVLAEKSPQIELEARTVLDALLKGVHVEKNILDLVELTRSVITLRDGTAIKHFFDQCSMINELNQEFT